MIYSTKIMDTLIQGFKEFHNISENISLTFREKNGVLQVKDKEEWKPLSYKNNKFYTKSVLKRKKNVSIDCLRALKLEPELIKHAPVFAVPTMDDIKEEMLSKYILDTPIPKELSAPLKPSKLTLYFEQTPWTIGNFLRGFQMDMPEGHELENDSLVFLEEVKPQIIDKLKIQLKELGGIKFNLGLKVLMRKDDEINGDVTLDAATFYHEQIPVINKDEIELNNAFSTISERIEKYLKQGSGWKLERIETLWLNIANYQPLQGGSYIDLPKYLKDKQAIINVKNEDDNCLRWSLRSAMFPASRDPQRISKYPVDDGLNFKDIDAPTPISQIKKVERQNNLAINVFGFEKST